MSFFEDVESLSTTSESAEELEEVHGLTQEKLTKIIALQAKFDFEIRHLAAECNLEPEFVKGIMKDYREPAPKKFRKTSGWNAWQTEWWKDQKSNINSPLVQQKCALEWKELDAGGKEQFVQAANEINKYRGPNNMGLIENVNKRKSELNKQIRELRKISRTLQISCGMELLTISVSYLGDINPNCFGTTVGEDFYAYCNKFDEILTTFQSFAILKKSERNQVTKKYIIPHEIHENTSINSRKTRDEVRRILREKFSKATGKEMIPYKNWLNQSEYSVHGWPSNVSFADYANLTDHNKVLILSALDNIDFIEN